jgi:hypothetical protein
VITIEVVEQSTSYGKHSMWESPNGIRTLEGAEADLVRHGTIILVDQIKDEIEIGEPIEYGAPLFDKLPSHQKLAVLSGVANALLSPDVDAPERCAVDDSAVAVIFEVIKVALEAEVHFADEYDGVSWTHMILSCRAAKSLAASHRVDAKCKRYDTWYELVDSIRDGVLVDHDWMMAHYFLDGKPNRTRKAAMDMGITRDYFVTPAPDPKNIELPGIISGLNRLLATSQ